MKNLTPEEAVACICNADSKSEALAIYIAEASKIQDYKIVLASQVGASMGFAVNRKFAKGATVRSLFKAERILVFDPTTIRDLLDNPLAKFPFDYSIALDTQAFSYLKPYVAGKAPEKINPDIQEVFDFIAQEDVFVDPIPYIAENTGKFGGDDVSAADILENMKAYEVLRTLDKQHYATTKEARSYLSADEIATFAENEVAKMRANRNDPSYTQGLGFNHAFEYACLLKMAFINFKHGGQSVDKRVVKFTEFGDEKLATFPGREFVIAKSYFERGQKLGFFSRVQKKKSELFKILKNMAWDLAHARTMELCLTIAPDPKARYFFPALLTFDKDFIEILDLYPLKACAFQNGIWEPMPFFEGDWFDVVASTDKGKVEFFERFFSDAAIDSRTLRREGVREAMSQIVSELETELLTVAEI